MLGVNDKMITVIGIVVVGILLAIIVGMKIKYDFVSGELEETIKVNKELTTKVMAGKVNESTLKAMVDKQNTIYSKLSIEYDKKVREFEKWKHTDRDKYIKKELPELEGESDECEDIINAINVINSRGL